MASTPFTLAALATSAVPGLAPTGARSHTSGSGGSFLSAVLETEDGEVIVRVPQHAAAEVQQSGELLGRAALHEGARERMPFAVPTTLGITRAGETRAVVSTFLVGTPARIEYIEADSDLLQRTAEAIAAIHELPPGIVQQGGLPVRSAEEVRESAGRLVQRASQTGVLPATVLQRWSEAIDADSLWNFEPTVVHGSLDADQLLVEGHEVLGVLGWNELSIGDPAADLAWVFAGGPEVFEAVLGRYALRRGVSGQQQLAARAGFHHELEVAKWLLHGVESRDQSVIDDAVTMLDRLVDRMGLLGAPVPARPVLTESEVEQLLDETPEVGVDPRSETAEFEALDEDRAFEMEREFDEPAQPENEPAQPDAAEQPSGSPARD